MQRDDRRPSPRPAAGRRDAPRDFGSIAIVVGGKRPGSAPPPRPASRPFQPPPVPRQAPRPPSPASALIPEPPRLPPAPPVPRQAPRRPPPQHRSPALPGRATVERAASVFGVIAHACRGFVRTVLDLRNAGRVVIVVPHRPSLLEAVNMALLIHSGRMIAFSPDDQVFRQMAPSFGRNSATAPAPDATAAFDHRAVDHRALDPGGRGRSARQQAAGPASRALNTGVMQERRRNATR